MFENLFVLNRHATEVHERLVCVVWNRLLVCSLWMPGVRWNHCKISASIMQITTGVHGVKRDAS